MSPLLPHLNPAHITIHDPCTPLPPPLQFALPFRLLVPPAVRLLGWLRPGCGVPMFIPFTLLRRIAFKLALDLQQLPALNQLVVAGDMLAGVAAGCGCSRPRGLSAGAATSLHGSSHIPTQVQPIEVHVSLRRF